METSVNPDETQSASAHFVVGRRRAVLTALYLGALAIAGYLAFHALMHGGTPPGCGAGAGCGEVLASRWSRLWGVPVAVLAIVAYMAALHGLWRRGEAGVFVASAGAILAAAAWFGAVQLVLLKAFCIYCTTGHVLGAAASIFGLVLARRRGVAMRPVLLGVLAIIIMAGVQAVQPARVYSLNTAGAGDGDMTVGGRRTVSVFNGQLKLALDDEPVLGRRDAARVLVLLFDYACPHCQRLHDDLQRMIASRPGEVAVVLVPVAMWNTCNPYIKENGSDRFRHSCELTKIAMAVQHAAPQRFGEFDRWLFATTHPRDPGEARLKAAELVGVQLMLNALDSPDVAQRVKRNMDAYGSSGASRVPIVAAPGKPTHHGKVEDLQVIEDLLR